MKKGKQCFNFNQGDNKLKHCKYNFIYCFLHSYAVTTIIVFIFFII